MDLLQNDLVPFDEMKQALRGLTEQQQTGTLYIATEQQGGGLVLLNGKIIQAGFATYRGAASLARISHLDRVRYLFKQGQTSLPGAHGQASDLPQTTEILSLFDGIPLPQPAEEAVPVEEVFDITDAESEVMEKKVLVIEDSPMVRRVVRFSLTKEGYTVLEATDGEHGIELVKSERPGLILLDLVLPGMGGYEVLESIRNSEEGKDAYVIILTSSDTLLDQVKEGALKANEYLTKPFQPDELLEKVREYIP